MAPFPNSQGYANIGIKNLSFITRKKPPKCDVNLNSALFKLTV